MSRKKLTILVYLAIVPFLPVMSSDGGGSSSSSSSSSLTKQVMTGPILQRVMSYAGPCAAAAMVYDSQSNAALKRSFFLQRALGASHPVVMTKKGGGVALSIVERPNGEIVSGSSNGKLFEWNPCAPRGKHFKREIQVSDHADPKSNRVKHLVLRKNGQLVTGSGLPQKIQVRDMCRSEGDELVKTVHTFDPGDMISGLVQLENGLVASSSDTELDVDIWNVDKPSGRERITTFEGCDSVVGNLAVMPNNLLVVGSHFSKKVRLWDLSNPLSPRALRDIVASSMIGPCLLPLNQEHLLLYNTREMMSCDMTKRSGSVRIVSKEFGTAQTCLGRLSDHEIISVNPNGVMTIHNLETGEIKRMKVVKGAQSVLGLSGKRVAVGGRNGVRVYPTEEFLKRALEDIVPTTSTAHRRRSLSPYGRKAAQILVPSVLAEKRRQSRCRKISESAKSDGANEAGKGADSVMSTLPQLDAVKKKRRKQDKDD